MTEAIQRFPNSIQTYLQTPIWDKPVARRRIASPGSRSIRKIQDQIKKPFIKHVSHGLWKNRPNKKAKQGLAFWWGGATGELEQAHGFGLGF